MRPGDRIGRDVVTGFLGQGGMGQVYRAHDEVLHRQVALKLLRTEADEPEAKGSAPTVKGLLPGGHGMVRYSPDERRVAVLDGITGLTEVDEATFAVSRRLTSGDQISSFAYAGKRIAVAPLDGWRLGRCIRDARRAARRMQVDPSMHVHLTIAGRSDVGLARKNNEDALLIADVASGVLYRGEAPQARLSVGAQGVLLAVSDGMGGEEAGEVASAVTVEAFARALVEARPDAPTDARIEDAVQEANREVLRAAQEPGHEGMGATLTAILVQVRDGGATAFVAEVGDSRAYLLRSERITRLTKDQSYTQILLDAGLLDAQEAAGSPLHNVILQAMGRDHIGVALGKVELGRRDCLLLCSDGLSTPVSDDEIRGTVVHAPDLGVACAELVRLAKERGGVDDVTVLAAGVGGDLAPPRAGGPPLEVLVPFEPPVRH